ncbi:MAG TPA: MFS transporter [Candidatus Polarisedimenticolia bacterium]|nr:MFS transporter [Candidatus Polarisedimenticolia bacterium]
MLNGRALAVLFLTLFLLMLGVGIIIPNIAYQAQALRASSFQISLLFTLYSLMQFLCAPFWGRLSDRTGRKPVLLLGLLGNAAGLALYGISSTLPMLYAARALSGLMSSAALPSAMAYVADVTDDKSRGRGMGYLGAAMGLGFIFGPALGGILSRFGHGVPFLAAAALNLLTCLLAAVLLRESLGTRATPAGPAPEADGVTTVLQALAETPISIESAARRSWPLRALGSPLLPFYLVAFFVTFAMAALESIFPLFIQARFGYGAHDMGTMFLFMGTAVFLVQGVLLGRLIQAMGEENVMLAGLLVNALGFLLVVAASGRISLTAALLISGVGNQVMRPTNASLITKRTTRGRGAAIGIMDSFDSAGRILGPIVAGSLYGPHPTYPYLVSAAILATAGSGLWLWKGLGRNAPGPGADDVSSSGAP